MLPDELLLVFILIGLVSIFGIWSSWDEVKMGIELVARCPRCSGMREWRHRCPDSVVQVSDAPTD